MALASGTGGPTARVRAIAIDDSSNVYVGGDDDFVWRWTTGTGAWASLGGVTPTTATVTALAVRGNDLFVGGNFSGVGGATAQNIAKYNIVAGTWATLDPVLWTAGAVSCVAFNGSQQAYAVGTLPSKHVYAYVNGAWSSSVPSGAGANGFCKAAAVDRYGGRVYVAGSLTSVGGITANRVAVWNDFEPIHITDLGSFVGTGPNFAHGVNNNGVVVGECYGLFGGSFNYHAYDWTSPGPLRDRGSLGSGLNSWAAAINDSWQIVGGAADFGQTVGQLWTQTSIPEEFGNLINLPSGTSGEASAINKAGYIAGSGLNSVATRRAIYWVKDVWSAYTTINRTPIDLQTLGGIADTLASYAYGINGAGKIVGKSVTGPGGPFHAYRTSQIDPADPRGLTIISTDDLGTMSQNPSTDYSEAQAINDFDEVVGASMDGSTPAVTNAFVHRPSTGFTDLNALPGHNYSIAYAINNAGQVVGYSKSGTGSSDRAFLWQNGGLGMRNLNDLIAAGTGLELHSAEWINDAGKIVGWALGHDGQNRGFLLDPSK